MVFVLDIVICFRTTFTDPVSGDEVDALMGEIAGEACALARSHYGHFLLLSVSLTNQRPPEKLSICRRGP